MNLKGYKCAGCGGTNCKLWRPYMTFLPVDLLCAPCAAKAEDKSIEGIDADGKRPGRHGLRTDQIGWHVPAVPTEDGSTFWGYTSIPEEGCVWWRALPTMPTGETVL